MSESDHIRRLPVVTGLTRPPRSSFVARNGGHSAIATTPVGGGGGTAWEATRDDEWPDRGPRKGIRHVGPHRGSRRPVDRRRRASGEVRPSSAATARPRARRRARHRHWRRCSGAGAPRRTGSAAPGPAALGGAATGTVTEVSGSTLYVTNSSGDLVKVTVGPSATVTRNAKSSLGSLEVGDTVVVQGTKASNGSVTATSVSATGAGVSSGFGGFPAGASTPTG